MWGRRWDDEAKLSARKAVPPTKSAADYRRERDEINRRANANAAYNRRRGKKR